MTKRNEDMARKIITAFKASLDANSRQKIGDEQYDMLEAMIREGMSKELNAAAEQVEELARNLRALTDKPELGM